MLFERRKRKKEQKKLLASLVRKLVLFKLKDWKFTVWSKEVKDASCVTRQFKTSLGDFTVCLEEHYHHDIDRRESRFVLYIYSKEGKQIEFFEGKAAIPVLSEDPIK